MDNYLPKTPQDYVSILKRRKKLVVIPFAIVLLLGVIAYPFIPKYYSASAVLAFNDDGMVDGMLESGQKRPSIEKRISALLYWMRRGPVRNEIADLMGLNEGSGVDAEERERLYSLTSRTGAEVLPGDLVSISYRDSDPEFAQSGANAIAQTLVKVDRENKAQVAQERIEFIEEQLRIYKEKLEQSEKPFLISQTSSQLNDAMDQRSMILDKLYHLEKMVKPQQRAENPVIFKLQQQLLEARSEWKRAKLNAREGSPIVRELSNKVDELEAALSLEKEGFATNGSATVNPEYLTVLRDLKAVNNEISELRRQKSNLESGETEIESISREEISALNRQKAVTEDIYQGLLRGLESAQLSQRLDAHNANGSFRLLERAGLPSEPSWPDPLHVAGLILFAGFVASGGAVFLKEFTDTSFRNGSDAQENLQLPLLASIPTFQVMSKNRAIPAVAVQGQMSPRLVAYHNTQSLAAEHYRLLRAQLHLLQKQRALKTVLVTSATAFEGKTTTTCNLAVSMATDLNQRILLVDTDLRQGAVAKNFGLSQKRGLSDFLTGNASSEEIIKRTPLPRLSVVTSGSPVPNPSKILNNDTITPLFDEFRRRFDFILMDAPPVIPLSDVANLSRMADGIVFTVKVGQTPRAFVRSAVTQLEQSRQAPVLGYVLTHTEEQIPEYVKRYFVGGVTLSR